MQVVDTTNVTRIYSSRDLAALFRLEAPAPPVFSSESDTAWLADSHSKSSLCNVSSRVKSVIEGDHILTKVLEGQSKQWITKIGRHQDAVQRNQDEDLSRKVNG